MASNKEAFALGLAQKAGKVVSGDFAVRTALKAGSARLLVLAADTAPNSKKELRYLAEQAGVPVIELLTRWELGGAMGKGQRAAACITDSNFASMLLGK
ncbi:MAG: ribosomal L7Ae/L30e/S12e/Gadd45 family protein [Phascolarctobacterium sp.]|nr:ribosomal L7Ae/L30e/S12e/Gadd45 family protein [Phascolarctobacterium sp.]